MNKDKTLLIFWQIFSIILVILLGFQIFYTPILKEYGDLIIFEKNVINDFKSIWEQSQYLNLEQGLCLYGEYKNNITIITETKSIDFVTTENSVKGFQNCPKDSLIAMYHTHPNEQCYFSDSDLEYYGYSKHSLNLRATIVQCKNDVLVIRTGMTTGVIKI